MVNLEGKPCVVVGGGRVAERRVEALLRQDAGVRLVAPEATELLVKLSDLGRLTWIRVSYSPLHLDGAFLVVAATDNREVNRTVARDAQARNLLVTCADEPADGNYITPSVIKRGEFVIAVSTGGASPTLAALIRERLEAEYGPEWAGWTTLFKRLRSQIQKIPLEAERKATVSAILRDDMIRRHLSNDHLNEAEAAASQCISSHLESAMPAHP
jgi:precorrin-2 dehydrogenase/sirohydrochlorin ferrochelatase